MGQRLPLVGKGSAKPGGAGEATFVERAMVIVPAYPTAPVWTALERVTLPILALAEGDALASQELPAPRPHRRIAGPRAAVLGALPEGPQVLVGDAAGAWVRGSLVVVVAGAVGRSGWSQLAREVEAGLVLRSIRPGTLAEVERRFVAAR